MMPTANIIWSEPNRSAALAVLALGGTVHIRATARGEDKPIKAAADLPDAYFRVSRVSLARVEKPLSDLCSKLALLDDSEFDSLTEFDLAGSSFTNEDLARLGSQKRATHLSLSGPKVSQDGLAHLKNWPALQRLTLDGLELRGPDLSPLKRLAELTELRLGCKTLTDLFAVQIGELKTLAKLEKLSLAGSAIGDETLKRLHDFPALKELDLTGIKVSAEAVIAAKKALPNCKIIGPGK